jgi:hypothetical protein
MVLRLGGRNDWQEMALWQDESGVFLVTFL